MNAPRRPNAALRRLGERRGIQHGQLGSDLDAVLTYVAAVEEDAAGLRAREDLVARVRARLLALVQRVDGELAAGPGARLKAELADLPTIPNLRPGGAG